MKSLLALIVLMTVGTQAHAFQTADCGNNMAQLKDVIARKYSDLMDPSYVDRFVGTWQSTTNSKIVIHISRSQNFAIGYEGKTYTYHICPQAKGEFFVQITPAILAGSNSGLISYQGGRVGFSYGAAQLEKANGTYVKVNTLGDG